MFDTDAFFKARLDELAQAGALRRTEAWPASGSAIRLADGKSFLNFSSNDYLSLASDPLVRERSVSAIERWGCGASASRLMSGTLELHAELEAALASLAGRQGSLAFSSGFGMNVGIVPALAGKADTIYLDRICHASLVDGARLSGAQLKRFPHNDAAALRKMLASSEGSGLKIIITESVFSMDGDIAPLADLGGLAAEHKAMLLVDEAHAIGVWNNGGGLCSVLPENEKPCFTLGTLGKSLGSLGGFAACSATAREYLVNLSRSFIFATALPPASVGAALGAVERIRQEPNLGGQLLARARAFHALLAAQGLRLNPFQSQIIPIHVGGNEEALAMAAKLRGRGILATAIRPPTVPAGTARLRLSVTLGHKPAELEWAAQQIGQAAREAKLI